MLFVELSVEIFTDLLVFNVVRFVGRHCAVFKRLKSIAVNSFFKKIFLSYLFS